MEVMGRLEGAFALLLKSTHFPGELIAAKRGSPLIMGVKKQVRLPVGPNRQPQHRCSWLRCKCTAAQSVASTCALLGIKQAGVVASQADDPSIHTPGNDMGGPYIVY